MDEIEQLRARVAQLIQRVIQKDVEFEQEREVWRRKERAYQRAIRELKATARREDDVEF